MAVEKRAARSRRAMPCCGFARCCGCGKRVQNGAAPKESRDCARCSENAIPLPAVAGEAPTAFLLDLQPKAYA